MTPLQATARKLKLQEQTRFGKPNLKLVENAPRLQIQIAQASHSASGETVNGDVVKVIKTPNLISFLVGDVMGHGPKTQIQKKELVKGFSSLTPDKNGLINFVQQTDLDVSARAKKVNFKEQYRKMRLKNRAGLPESQLDLDDIKYTPRWATGIVGNLKETGDMELFNMGHGLFWVIRGGKIIQPTEEAKNLPKKLFPLGMNHKKGLKGPMELKLQHNDLALFVTDGITEHKNRKGERFGTERLLKLVQKNKHLTPEEIRDRIFAKLAKFSPKRIDDSSVLIMKATRKPKFSLA